MTTNIIQTRQVRDANGVLLSTTLSGISTNITAAYTQANNAYGKANIANTNATSATGIAVSAYAQANTASNQANSGYTQANLATSVAGVSYNQANAAYAQANSAYGVANSAANTVTVLANGTVIVTSGNLNFNNTSTINVSVSANGSQSNVALSVNTSAVGNGGGGISNVSVFVGGVLVKNTANLNYAASNVSNISITSIANSSPGNATIVFDLTIPSYNVAFNNSSSVNVVLTANGSTSINAAFNLNTNSSYAFSGTMTSNANPVQNVLTTVFTGVENHKPTSTTAANNSLTNDSNLIVTLNETGIYDIDAFLAFYESGTSTGGFQFDFGAGVASANSFVAGITGYSTAANTFAAITSITATTNMATVSGSSSAPSWVRIVGQIKANSTGTFGIRWAQNTTLAPNPTTLLQGSYIKLVKVG